MIFGGFELSTPNVPTDSIYSLSLASLFLKNAALNAKIKSKEDLVDYKGEPKSPSTPNTPNMRPSANTPPSMEKPKPSTPKRRIPLIMEPAVVGKIPIKPSKLNSKFDIALKFLDTLMQPNNFMNSDAIKLNFRAEEIISLCNIAE